MDHPSGINASNVNLGKYVMNKTEELVNKLSEANHKFLIKFVEKYNKVPRGGVHDFMEMLVSTLLEDAIKQLDNYLKPGHTNIDQNQITAIIIDAFQKRIDNIKRNLEEERG